MEKPFDKKYSSPKYLNPSDDVDYRIKRATNLEGKQKEVQAQYYLDKCEWLYSSYMRGDCYIPYSKAIDYALNRLYAQGMQPINKYRDKLTIPNKEDPQAGRKGWMNISWDILPIVPKFRSIILGKFEDIDYNIMVRAIDEQSNSARDEAKLQIMVESKYGELLNMYRELIGKDQSPEMKDAKLPYIPKTAEELEMMNQLGAIKLAWEVSMDRLCNDTQMKVNWPEIKRRLMEDAVDLGVIAVKDYQDPQTNLPGIRYVDPANLIIRQSRFNDYYDVTEAGEVTWYTIEQLRSFGISDEDLQAAASLYQNQWNNPSMPYGFGNGQNAQTRDTIDSFRVAVLDCEFQSFDRMFFEGRMQNEREVLHELPHGSVKPTNKKNKFYPTQKPKFYRCKWIIGSKVIFDYGLQFDVPYKQKTQARSSYSCYRIADRSMINQIIASVDDFQMKVYKLRNAIAEATPAGIIVEIGHISNITLGGNKMAPLDIFTMFNHTGKMLWKAQVNHRDGLMQQGGPPPIMPYPGGVGPYLQELLTGMQHDLNMIRETTGLNAVVDASTPAPDALVGTAKIAEAATNHVLRPILYSYKSVKQRCFANITNRWQIVAKFYPQSVTTNIGNAAFETVKITTDLYEPIFDTYCDAIISDEEKLRLDNAMTKSLDAAKAGSIGISPMDYFYLRDIIGTGNIRWAWVYLSYREAKIKEDQMAAAAATQQQVGQQSMQQEAMKQQAEERKIMLEGNEKRKTIMVQELEKRKTKLMELQAEAAMPKPAPASPAK